MDDQERQIEVTENDELVIPLEQTEEVQPGILRIKPSAALREWAKRQGEIKIG
jgi:hypothetical protein